MGMNYRFRISEMMPNTWFYKLKDMGRRGSKNQYSAGRSQHQTPRSPTTSAATSKLLPARGSLYYSRRAEEGAAERSAFSPTHLRRRASDALYPIEPPRMSKKSSRRKPGAGGVPAKPRSIAPSLSAACRESVVELSPPETPSCRRDCYVEYDHFASWPHSCNCRAASSAADVLIDISTSTSSAPKQEKLEAAELNLPPILTKPTAKEPEFEDKGVVGKERTKGQAKRSSAGLLRLRMRANSPRTPGKKPQARRGRRSTSSSAAAGKGGVAASFAVVKASTDPQRDFRESMMEMIRENEIRTAKDLEELLACYLSLNANEYHDVIVKVFQQIWFDLNLSCIKLVDY